MFFVLSAVAVRGPRIKAAVMNRIVAKMVDLGIVFAASAILPYPIGPLLGFGYSIAGDGLKFNKTKSRFLTFTGGQSIGKRLMKLQVVSTETRQPVSYRESALRNEPVGVATFFAIIPVWGWIILALIGLPLMLMEIYLMVTVEMGYRLGDLMGKTEVTDAPLSERPDGGSASAFER